MLGVNDAVCFGHVSMDSNGWIYRTEQVYILVEWTSRANVTEIRAVWRPRSKAESPQWRLIYATDGDERIQLAVRGARPFPKLSPFSWSVCTVLRVWWLDKWARVRHSRIYIKQTHTAIGSVRRRAFYKIKWYKSNRQLRWTMSELANVMDAVASLWLARHAMPRHAHEAIKPMYFMNHPRVAEWLIWQDGIYLDCVYSDQSRARTLAIRVCGWWQSASHLSLRAYEIPSTPLDHAMRYALLIVWCAVRFIFNFWKCYQFTHANLFALPSP